MWNNSISYQKHHIINMWQIETIKAKKSIKIKTNEQYVKKLKSEVVPAEI